MLQDISNALKADLTVHSQVFYTAVGLFAGRKFCAAAAYKMGGKVAELIGRQNVAEWNKASSDAWTLAKKDALRDLTAVAGFIGATALVLGTAEALLPEAKKATSAEDIKEKPLFDNIIIDFIKEHPYVNTAVISVLTIKSILKCCGRRPGYETSSYEIPSRRNW